jgi:hypothetical protein
MSATKYFGKKPCEICGHPLTNNARARVSHLRAHVRDGEARQVPSIYKLRFEPIKK